MHVSHQHEKQYIRCRLSIVSLVNDRGMSIMVEIDQKCNVFISFRCSFQKHQDDRTDAK